MWMENGAGEELGKQNIELSVFGDSDGKESACSAGDPGLIPGFGRSPGRGHVNPFQYSCLENPMIERPGGLQSLVLQSQTHLND